MKNLEVYKQNKEILKLITEFNIPDEILLKYKFTLDEFLSNNIECKPGPLSDCLQIVKGQEEHLSFFEGVFYINSRKCAHYFFENKNYMIKENYLYVDFDVDLFSKTAQGYSDLMKTEKIFSDDEIDQRILYMKNSLLRVQNKMSGFFLFGKPGIGKTTVTRALANTMAYRGKKVYLTSVVNLSTKLKKNLSLKQDSKYLKIVQDLKKADVLFLDDIGGETVSTWFRDEILMGILEYRYDRKKTTFFTSNFTIVQLKTIYFIQANAKNGSNEIEEMKVARLVDRIKGLSEQFELNAVNSKRYK